MVCYLQLLGLLRLTSFCSSPPSSLEEIELFSVNHCDTVCRYCGSWKIMRDWICTSTRSLHPGMGSSVGRYSLCSTTLWELTKTAVITRGVSLPWLNSHSCNHAVWPRILIHILLYTSVNVHVVNSWNATQSMFKAPKVSMVNGLTAEKNWSKFWPAVSTVTIESNGVPPPNYSPTSLVCSQPVIGKWFMNRGKELVLRWFWTWLWYYMHMY